MMCKRISLAGIGLAVAAGLLPSPAAAQGLHTNQLKPGLLRVCADPDNMPLSSEKAVGFEQKIAELIAKDWDTKVEYAWWPVRRGFFSRALNGRYCDVAIQAPAGLDMAGVTKPYFRSGYVFLTRKDSGLNIKNLADPRLKKLRIGVNLLNSDAENTPPAMALSLYGVVGNLTGFTTFYTDQDRPESIVRAVESKEVDVAIVWGPLAGYFAKSSKVPLAMTPLPEVDSLSQMPFRFNIAMGVRRRDKELRDSLDNFLQRKAPEIQAVLKEYGVPTFPIVEDKGGDDDDGPPAPKATSDSTRSVGQR
jgi:mxaJ protein